MSTLAVDGGRPVRADAMPTWPVFDEEEASAARDVLLSGRINYLTGSHGRAFESEFAAVTGTRYAVAVTNGTVALELALHSIGVRAGDEVVIPAATFFATASAVARCGALPVIADVDLHSQCLTPATVEAVLSPRTRAVIVVHVAGHPAEMTPLLSLTRDRGIRLVEDCAQAHGARYADRPVGGFGDIAAWSFCQDKIVTTAGEGGAITTSDPELWRRCWELKDHGKNMALMFGDHVREPGFQWLHDSFGTNARMTEVQSSIGRVQLGKLAKWVHQRRMNAAILLDAFREQSAIRAENPPAHVEHAYYRFYAHIREEELRPGWNRDRVVAAIIAEGVPCAYGGCAEIYRERAFEDIPGVPDRLPVAAELGRTSLTLPVHPGLNPADLTDVTAAVAKVLQVASA
jgi:dTDP-4-amino-4,6-dideoxygalactose transaminase